MQDGEKHEPPKVMNPQEKSPFEKSLGNSSPWKDSGTVTPGNPLIVPCDNQYHPFHNTFEADVKAYDPFCGHVDDGLPMVIGAIAHAAAVEAGFQAAHHGVEAASDAAASATTKAVGKFAARAIGLLGYGVLAYEIYDFLHDAAEESSEDRRIAGSREAACAEAVSKYFKETTQYVRCLPCHDGSQCFSDIRFDARQLNRTTMSFTFGIGCDLLCEGTALLQGAVACFCGHAFDPVPTPPPETTPSGKVQGPATPGPEPGSGRGGAPATGGAPPATGGAPPATGGAPPATGGAPPATGGAPPATGGGLPPGGLSSRGGLWSGGGYRDPRTHCGGTVRYLVRDNELNQMLFSAHCTEELVEGSGSEILTSREGNGCCDCSACRDRESSSDGMDAIT